MKKRVLILSSALALVVTGLFTGTSLTSASPDECEPTESSYDSDDTRYTVLSFTQTGASCTWIKPTGLSSLDYLIVAGGGGGGGRHGGGGGGGGVLSATEFDVSNISETTITVGAGGAGSPYLATQSSTITQFTQKGANSSAFGYEAIGGGPGAGKATNPNYSGGSGGGSDSNSNNNESRTGVEGQGFAGGAGVGGGGEVWSGGGGGGAGAAGGSATSGIGGDGGAGLTSSITGASLIYAAGGGGGTDGTRAGTGGSSGVGGDGGNRSGGSNGLDGRGGGGGGAGHDGGVWAFKGGDGGDGIVIIRYIAPPTISETNGIVISVDPRSESVSIPYLSATSSASSRICVDLVSNANSSLALKSFVNKNTNSNAFRMAVTFDDVSVEVGAENSLNKITASRTNAPSLLKRNAPNNESYLRLYRPSDGWSNVNGGKLKIGIDYLGSDCSSGSFPAMNIEIPIKVLDLVSVQKNPIDLSRN